MLLIWALLLSSRGGSNFRLSSCMESIVCFRFIGFLAQIDHFFVEHPTEILILKRWEINPFDSPCDPSTALRTSARGMPFDKLKAPSKAERLRVDTERRFLPRFKNRSLAPSNVSIRMRGKVFRLFGNQFRTFVKISSTFNVL